MAMVIPLPANDCIYFAPEQTGFGSDRSPVKSISKHEFLWIRDGNMEAFAECFFAVAAGWWNIRGRFQNERGMSLHALLAESSMVSF